jgi:anti-anti-sigma factor
MSASGLTVDHVALPPEHALMVLRGPLNPSNTPQLRHGLDQCLHDPALRYLVLDLSQVSTCEPAALPLLAATARQLCQRHGWLRLVATHPAVLDALDTTSLADLLAIYSAHNGTPHATSAPPT